MDWELYDRYRSTLLLAGLLLVSSILFIFQRTSSVQYLRAFLVRFALPPQRLLTQMKAPMAPPSPAQDTVGAESPSPTAAAENENQGGEERRKIQVLREENERLRDVLELKKEKWPRAIVAHVAGRDPQRWFQEIVLDKGKDDGLEIDGPVLAEFGGRESLIGRIVETSAHVSKVMLVQDSLSAVAATVAGDLGEDGVVEGTNAHELVLKFLDRASQVKIGDLVTTSGLGKAFPPGVAIGWVEDIEPDPRQLFLQAKLRPAARSNRLRTVLVLASGGNDR
jgi:rod shape-determining protein MreC